MPVLPALYLPYVEGERHAFAVRLREFATSAPPGSVLVLHAPTGAGKTHAVLDLAREGRGVLLGVPTNALTAEVEATYRRFRPDGVARWNADGFTTHGRERHEEMINHSWGKDLIVTNPDILHLFTQHAYIRPDARIRLSHEGLRNLSLLVFDEYHAYDERILASLLLHILRARVARDHRQRFVFMSATPEPGLVQALRALKIPFQDVPDETPTTGRLPEGKARLLKGEVELQIRTDAISASVREVESSQRTLFVFNTFLEQQRAFSFLREAGWKEADEPGCFVQITGRHTRIGQSSWGRASVLLATSKVDVGLNIDGLDALVMEPGRSDQQFWQRFGRAARGRRARVTLHFTDYHDQALARLRAATNLVGLAEAMRDLLRPSRTHVDTLLRFVGAYAASYHANTPRSFVREAFGPGAAFEGQAATGRGLIATMYATWKNDILRDVTGGSRHWFTTIHVALRGLRGKALEVPTLYPGWSQPVPESIIYVLCRTDAQKSDAHGVYHVNEILEKPRDAQVGYLVLDGQRVSVPVKGAILQHDFQRLPKEIENVVREEEGTLSPFWEALVAWLRMIPPDEIPPLEVTPDDIFV